jgi:hypothetical protein
MRVELSLERHHGRHVALCEHVVHAKLASCWDNANTAVDWAVIGQQLNVALFVADAKNSGLIMKN